MEVAPGIYSLWQQKGAYVHAYLLDDGKELTLIDTLYDTDAKRILDQIAQIGKTVKDLKRIIMTHSHRSHLGGLALLKELSGAPVYAHVASREHGSGEPNRPRLSCLARARWSIVAFAMANPASFCRADRDVNLWLQQRLARWAGLP